MSSFPSGDRSRVLVKAANWLGDVVMGIPALRALRRAAPGAHLAVMVRTELAPLLAGQSWIDEVLPYRHPAGADRFWRLPGIVAAIRAARFDWGILFPSRPEPALWLALARVPRRVGYSLHRRSWLLTHRAIPSPAIRSGHESEWYLDLLRQTLGVDGSLVDFALEVDPAAERRMAEWLGRHRRRDRPLAALAPAAAYGPAKEWPAEHYAELVDLLDEAGWDSVLVGGPAERARALAVAERSQRGALIAAGETDVAELAALLAASQGFVGNDSGPMHLAAALGVPTIGLFGSTAAERTGPRGSRARVLHEPIDCSPCLARTCRYGHMLCLRSIAPRRVAAALLEVAAAG